MDEDLSVSVLCGFVALVGGALILALYLFGDAASTPVVVALVFLAAGAVEVRAWIAARSGGSASPDPPAMPPSSTPACPKCHGPTEFSAENGRWYCPRDRRFL